MSRLPSFNLQRIARLRQTLANSKHLAAFFCDRPLDGDEIKDLAQELLNELPEGIEWRTIYASCLYLGSVPLTEKELDRLCWRLAANLPRLRSGKSVPPWTHQTKDEWMPLQIVQVMPRYTARTQLGGNFTARILAGTACGLTAQKFWTRKFCAYVSRDMGFTGRGGNRPFHNMYEFVGLRLCGLFVSELSQGQPVFDKVHIPPSCVQHNAALIALRSRAKSSCPRAYQHDCRICHVGYDQCPRAVRPRTMTLAVCKDCEEENWIDPSARGICPECRLEATKTASNFVG